MTDVTTGDENTTLTPGGGVNITGSKIRISGNSENIGISLTNTDTGDVTKVSTIPVLINLPSKVMFILPAILVAGTYTLTVHTRFSTAKTNLKEQRSYIF